MTSAKKCDAPSSGRTSETPAETSVEAFSVPEPDQLQWLVGHWHHLCRAEGVDPLPIEVVDVGDNAFDACVAYEPDGSRRLLIGHHLPAAPIDVQRWVLAHELGHHVLHPKPRFVPVFRELIERIEAPALLAFVAAALLARAALPAMLAAAAVVWVTIATIEAVLAARGRREEYEADAYAYAAGIVGPLPLINPTVREHYEPNLDTRIDRLNPWASHPTWSQRRHALRTPAKSIANDPAC